MAVYLISPDAMEDLKDIRDFIALDNPTAADDVIDKLFDALEDLAQWPGQGHTRRDLTDRNVRFWPIGSTSLCIARTQRHCKWLRSCTARATSQR